VLSLPNQAAGNPIHFSIARYTSMLVAVCIKQMRIVKNV